MELIERKNKLNSDSPQIPPWAWNEARERIKKGESEYAVDKLNRTSSLPAPEPVALSRDFDLD
jgi:hypothetical protein